MKPFLNWMHNLTNWPDAVDIFGAGYWAVLPEAKKKGFVLRKGSGMRMYYELTSEGIKFLNQ